MKTEPDSIDAIRKKLRDFVEQMPQSNQSELAIYRCVKKQAITNLSLSEPNLLLPLNGTKILETAHSTIKGTSEDLVMMPSGMEFNVMNIPDNGSHKYLGLVVRFDEETIALFRRAYDTKIPAWDVSPQWKCKATMLIYEVVLEWLHYRADHAPSELQQRHRLCELLLVLAEHRMLGNVLIMHKPTTSSQVRKIISRDVSKDWKIGEVSLNLSISESTLRRKLKLEDRSFRELLEEVRLLRGVGLVLESDLPIGAIAFECGYLSQSRFSQRFRQRFAMSPTELRSTQDSALHDVVELDRVRALKLRG